MNKNSVASPSEHKNKARPVLGFQLTQHSRDTALIEKFISFFNSGRLENINSATSFVVTKLSHNSETIVPFFNHYPLLGSKAKDFSSWIQAIEIMENKGHLTPSGLEKIISIKSNMNYSRTDSYSNLD